MSTAASNSDAHNQTSVMNNGTNTDLIDANDLEQARDNLEQGVME
jgi:hypothetical protein